MQVEIYRDEKWPYTFVTPYDQETSEGAAANVRDVPDELVQALQVLRFQEETAIQNIAKHLRTSGQEPVRS